LSIKLTNNFHYDLSFWDNFDSRPLLNSKKMNWASAAALVGAFELASVIVDLASGTQTAILL
jgi:hypothetical protein